MFTPETTESADRDLDGITDYIGRHLGNPEAALALLDEVDAVRETLESNPYAYPLCEDAHLADLGYHKAVMKAYIAVFEIDEDAKVVRILRYFHFSENYANKL